MFLKGFLCGWIAMTTIFAVLAWGVAPHGSGSLGSGDTYQQYGYDSRWC